MTETNSTLPGSIRIVGNMAHIRQQILDQARTPEAAPKDTPKFNSWGMDHAAFKTKEDELQEWSRIAKKLEARTGCKVLGFDPGFLIGEVEGVSATSIPFGLALVIIGEHPKTRGTLAQMAVRRQPKCLPAACRGVREAACTVGGRASTNHQSRRSSRSFSSLTRGAEIISETRTDNSEAEKPLVAAAVDIIAGRLGGMINKNRSRREGTSDVNPAPVAPSEGA